MLAPKRRNDNTVYLGLRRRADRVLAALNGSVATSSFAFRPWPARECERRRRHRTRICMLHHRPALARLAIARFRLQTVAKLMSASSSVNITELVLVDRCPLVRLQIRIVVLCGLVAAARRIRPSGHGRGRAGGGGTAQIAPNQFGFLFSSSG